MKKISRILLTMIFAAASAGPILAPPAYAKGQAEGKAKINSKTLIGVPHDDHDDDDENEKKDTHDDDHDDGEKHAGKKITICHIPPGNPTARHTRKVGAAAVNAHLAHGDRLGACKKMDIKTPGISKVSVTATATGAIVRWHTNEPSTSKVRYATGSLSTATNIQFVADANFTWEHSLAITGLQAVTSYFFQIESQDITGNISSLAEMTFMTQAAAPDAAPPVISSVAATSTTHTAAKIVWTTDEPSSSIVQYAVLPFAAATSIFTVRDNARVTTHPMMLSGLTASTTYHFRVKSVDASGNVATSVEMTFTTKTAPTVDTTAPVISGLTATSTTQTTSAIMWSTNVSSNSRVIFAKQSLATATTVWSVFNSMLFGLHDIMLSGLSTATQYFFRVESTDAAGNTTTSAQQTFTTQP